MKNPAELPVKVVQRGRNREEAVRTRFDLKATKSEVKDKNQKRTSVLALEAQPISATPISVTLCYRY